MRQDEVEVSRNEGTKGQLKKKRERERMRGGKKGKGTGVGMRAGEKALRLVSYVRKGRAGQGRGGE